MKNALLAFFALAIWMVGSSTGQGVSEPPRYTLSISAAHKEVKAGSAIAIQVVMTNTSNDPISIPAEIDDYGYVVDVTAIGDAAVSHTDRGRRGTVRADGR